MKRPWLVVVIVIIGLLMVGYWYLSCLPDTLPVEDAVVSEYAEVIADYYAPLTPLTIAGDTLQVSVADTVETRTKGLSDTPVLPPGLGKLFVFDLSDTWSFWMKDMQYPLDIVWLDEERRIVHIEIHVAPETYPETVKPPVPARYVLEVNAGVSDSLGWVVGDQAAW